MIEDNVVYLMLYLQVLWVFLLAAKLYIQLNSNKFESYWESVLAQGLRLTPRVLLNRNKKLLELELLKDIRRTRKTMVT